MPGAVPAELARQQFVCGGVGLDADGGTTGETRRQHGCGGVGEERAQPSRKSKTPCGLFD